MNGTTGFVDGFREVTLYIHYLRGKTLVVGISDSLPSGETLTNLAADLNLLASLGVRLVMVHGSRTQINAIAQAYGIEPQYHNHRRITDETVLQYAKQASGILCSDTEAALCSSASQTPQHSGPPAIASGNFLAAKSLGVIDGVDAGYMGVARKTDTEAVRRRLDDGVVVLISPLGYSFSGKILNLSMGEAAEVVAVALHAEKLVYTVEQEGTLGTEGCLITNLFAAEACQRIKARQICPNQTRLLLSAAKAVENGVGRMQIPSNRHDGSFICELFTRNGAGTSVAQNPSVSIRKVRSGDVPNITEMVRPLVEQGILLCRSREYLKNHTGSFSVIGHDCHIYGCVALEIFVDSDCGELACLVVFPDTRDGGYDEILLEHLFQKARVRHIRKLFALSIYTGEWLAERGFQAASADDLLEERRRDYMGSGRNSRVFVCDLAQSR